MRCKRGIWVHIALSLPRASLHFFELNNFNGHDPSHTLPCIFPISLALAIASRKFVLPERLANEMLFIPG